MLERANEGFTDVVHGFSNRLGGVSEGHFASLNLGKKWGDDPAAPAIKSAKSPDAPGTRALASAPRSGSWGQDMRVRRSASVRLMGRSYQPCPPLQPQ